MSERATLRAAVVGMSTAPACGVRDHAQLLAAALEAEQVGSTMHWLTREPQALGGERAEVRAWSDAVGAALARERPDVVLLHYSAFAFAHRGVPLFVPSTLRVLARAQAPVVSVMHEYAYPWHLGDLRGNVWALSQRAALIDVMRHSASVLATTDFRAEWLTRTRWLASRPVAFAPVYSNLPAPSDGVADASGRRSVGLFGYSYEGAAVSLVLDALRALRSEGHDLELRLLGAPGERSPAGQEWLTRAREAGVADAIVFSGRLEAQELADALAACEVLLFVDGAGPSSRKGTLTGSLASGSAVLALDGPARWREMVDAEALEVVTPTAEALARELGALLADEPRRLALGARGRAFAEQQMSPARTAIAIRGLADDALAR